MFKKVLCFAIVFSLFTNNIVMADDANIANENEIINEVKAQDLMEIKLESMAKGYKQWEGCHVEINRMLLSTDGTASGYLFDIVKDDEKVGYVITDSSENANIIEYGKDVFFEQASEEVENDYHIKKNRQKYYYLGGLDYAIGGKNNKNKNTYVDVSSADSVDDISLYEMGEIECGNSVPSSGFITDPSQYEDGYSEYSSGNVPGWNTINNFKLMTDFSDGSVCTPTAVTNLMLYYYSRNMKKYRSLYKNSWTKTYNLVYSYMHSTETGTTPKNSVTGISKYLRVCGFDSNVNYVYGTNNGQSVIDELCSAKTMKPCILFVFKNSNYGDHALLAMGYQKYVYKSWTGITDTYIYIRVVDGGTRSASRFVYSGNSGIIKNRWAYTSVTIK